jgi:multidrug resistance efflux pump
MKDLQDDLKIYSEEVRDVLSAVPNNVLKFGNSILLFFVVLLGFLSWFIEYPDIVKAEVVITTQIPPEKLVAKTSGKIQKIWIENHKIVPKNTPIAVIENSANYQDVFLLKNIVDTINYADKFCFPIDDCVFSNLGSIENAYTNFKQNYIAYQQYLDFQPYQVEKRTQSSETLQQKSRISLLEQQLKIASKELALKNKELKRYQILHEKGIIAAQEWESKEFDFLQQEKNYNILKSQLSQLKSSLIELEKNRENTSINEQKDDVVLLQNTIQSFHQLKKEIQDWDLNFVFRSTIHGRVSYFQVWSESQNISIGDQVFSIIPNDENMIAKLRVPSLNSGKIKLGQKVIIRLSNFPDREFGVLKGLITSISLLPNSDGMLLLDVTLSDGLKTTYHKSITFQQEMIGSADIVTEDLRLIERLLYQVRDVFRR